MAPSKKKRKRSKTEASSIEVAILYQQDLGTAGIKKKCRSEPVMTMNAFDLPMTKAEKKKRNKRKVRISRSKQVSWFAKGVVANPVLSYCDSSFA
jgi:hypothetical protein